MDLALLSLVVAVVLFVLTATVMVALIAWVEFWNKR